MKSNKIIGLSGAKRSGKSVVAQYLIDNYNYHEYAFAMPLKNALNAIFQFSPEQLHGNKKEEVDKYWGVSPRELMQSVGTDLFRNELGRVCKNFGSSNDIWVRCFERWVQTIHDNSEQQQKNINIVVSDIRFENEANKVRELGGIIINIKRNTDINQYSQHESENNKNSLSKYFNYEIENNSSKEELYEKIKKIIE